VSWLGLVLEVVVVVITARLFKQATVQSTLFETFVKCYLLIYCVFLTAAKYCTVPRHITSIFKNCLSPYTMRFVRIKL